MLTAISVTPQFYTIAVMAVEHGITVRRCWFDSISFNLRRRWRAQESLLQTLLLWYLHVSFLSSVKPRSFTWLSPWWKMQWLRLHIISWFLFLLRHRPFSINHRLATVRVCRVLSLEPSGVFLEAKIEAFYWRRKVKPSYFTSTKLSFYGLLIC